MSLSMSIPQKQIDLLAASMRQFGFVGVITVDEGNVIISGHGRHEAAKAGRDGRRPVRPRYASDGQSKDSFGAG
jgi:hypothetical protein